MSYHVGDSVRITATFTSIAGALADTTVTMNLETPAGVKSTPTMTKLSTGVYYYDLTGSVEGLYHCRVSGTGAVVASSGDRSIRFEGSRFV